MMQALLIIVNYQSNEYQIKYDSRRINQNK